MTGLQVHRLGGCAPAPLVRYLRALGLLRIVAEQKDSAVRGWWQDEQFFLLTRLDRSELERFVLEEYAPTGVLNPWGARSGFYDGSSEKTARAALRRIEASKLQRLSTIQSAISVIRSAILTAGGGKPEGDEEKVEFLAELRRRLRGSNQEWGDVAFALVGDAYRAPALMGTGGNEGSGSYSSAFLNAVVACVIDRTQDQALNLLEDGPGGTSPVAGYAWDGAFGQFLPEGEGSAWDLLLAFEGAIIFRSTIALRSQGTGRFLSSPFYFAPHAAGVGSSAAVDEFLLNKGRASPGRGEQWFPLWTAPAGLAEISAMVAEGRCTVGRHTAVRALEAARAVGRLGIARGISSFCRYGYMQRNNLASHFAVPLGRIEVRSRPRGRLVDEIASWHERLHREARKKSTPARLVDAEHRLADAIFGALARDELSQCWQSVLIACVSIENVQLAGAAVRAGPIPPLSPGWLEASNDGSVEWRLACALGSAAASYGRDARPCDPVRQHWLPLARDGRRYREEDQRLLRDARVVMSGRDAVVDFCSVVQRRLVEAVASGHRHLPLVAARECAAHPADLARFVAGEVDANRVSALARAFMAIRWEQWRPSGMPLSMPRGSYPHEAWAAVRLACLAGPLDAARRIPVDEAIVRRLTAGDAAAAIDIALRRLRAVGLRPPLRCGTADAETARRWAASLVFPISSRSVSEMARSFEPANTP